VTVAPAPPTLVARYSSDDLHLFDVEERSRFLAPFGELAEAALAGDEAAWNRIAPELAWELLYRKEPELWERLVAGERIHPGVIAWLPAARSAVELAAGSGRLTLDLAPHCERLVAIEPSAPFREQLERKLGDRGLAHVEVRPGFFDAIPLPDASADLVVSCSSFTSDPAHGGDAGLDEMRRVLAPGGTIALVWPSDVDWLRERGFRYECFDGDMCIDFGSLDEAVELAGIAYPWAVEAIAAHGRPCVPYELIGMNAPRDVAWMRDA
jgi:SAM-dependent methyltransferase